MQKFVFAYWKDFTCRENIYHLSISVIYGLLWWPILSYEKYISE
jgi:hypothetical protein